MKLHNKRVCVGVLKAANTIMVSSSRSAISRFVGAKPRNISRYMRHSSLYETDEFIIWCDVPVEAIKRGFACR